MRKEVINPHDKITIDCTNEKAAQLAVLIIGRGAYGIEGGILPIFILGGSDEWCQKTHGMSIDELFDAVPITNIVEALESIRLESEQTSFTSPVIIAQQFATHFRKKEAEEATR